MSYRGIYTPEHPEKYAGNANNIVYRSLWERRLFKFLDKHDNCLKWCSEEVVIPYVSVDHKWHRYFPDVLAHIKTKDGPKIFLIEVKPFRQTQPPKEPKRKTKNYYNELNTFAINQLKFEAAQKYCDKQGWKFQILTEFTLTK